MKSIRGPRYNLRWLISLRVLSFPSICVLAFAMLIVLISGPGPWQFDQKVKQEVTTQTMVTETSGEPDIYLKTRQSRWHAHQELVSSAHHDNRLLSLNSNVEGLIFFETKPENSDTKPFVSALGALCPSLRDSNLVPVVTNTGLSNTLATTGAAWARIIPTWNELAKFLPFLAFLTATASLLHVLTLRYALRPTKQIYDGLNCLACGEASCRLPNFRLFEFQRISNAFNSLAEHLDHKSQHKDALAARLVDGLEYERLRLAREIHDELAQAFAGMSAIIESIKATAEAECPKLVQEANKLLQISTSIQKSLAETLRNLSLSQIDDIGLEASLHALARSQEHCAGRDLNISVEICGRLRDIPRRPAAHIYRVAQEGLTNIVKHANADQAWVRLKYHKTSTDKMAWLIMMIEDNGSGLTKPQPADSTKLGLIGMRERVKALGGRLKISKNSQAGFRIYALIPFHL